MFFFCRGKKKDGGSKGDAHRMNAEYRALISVGKQKKRKIKEMVQRDIKALCSHKKTRVSILWVHRKRQTDRRLLC